MFAVVGCSGSTVINEGGDTTCKTFLAQDEGKQNDEITKMLNDEGKKDPAELEISGARTAAVTYCKTVGNENSKISDAPHL